MMMPCHGVPAGLAFGTGAPPRFVSDRTPPRPAELRGFRFLPRPAVRPRAPSDRRRLLVQGWAKEQKPRCSSRESRRPCPHPITHPSRRLALAPWPGEVATGDVFKCMTAIGASFIVEVDGKEAVLLHHPAALPLLPPPALCQLAPCADARTESEGGRRATGVWTTGET